MQSKHYIKKIDNIIDSYLLNKRFTKKENSDLKRLQKMFTSLDRDLVASRCRLIDKYNHYITNVSIGNSAASIEAASLLDVIARNNKVQRILDLGSGSALTFLDDIKRMHHLPLKCGRLIQMLCGWTKQHNI